MICTASVSSQEKKKVQFLQDKKVLPCSDLLPVQQEMHREI